MSASIEVGSVSAEQKLRNADEINLSLLTQRLVVLPVSVIECSADIKMPSGSRLAGLGQRQTHLKADYIVPEAYEHHGWLATSHEMRAPDSKRPWRFSGGIETISVARGLRIENLTCESIVLENCVDLEIERVTAACLILRRCSGVKLIDVDCPIIELISVSDSILERVRTNDLRLRSCSGLWVNNTRVIGKGLTEENCWCAVYHNCRQEKFDA